ncbi:MAG: polymorphic toxin-type HINT domain-containing protein, partial [Planctomycetota bacterium]
GSSVSGSAMQQQYATAGSNAIEQYCFPAGTEVLMANGEAKRIEQVKAGDVVASSDVAAKKLLVTVGAEADSSLDASPVGPASLVSGTVRETYHNAPQSLLHVHVGESSIATTDGHPFYVVTGDERAELDEGRWVLARELAPGDRLLASDGAVLTINAVTRDEGPAVPVYNFCVEEHHNYHVRLPGTEHFVLVHNESFGLYTYGHALVPVVIEALNDWVAEVTDQIEQMLDAIFSPVTDALNTVVEYVGVGVSLFNEDAGQSIIDVAIEGKENNTLFGVSASSIGIATISAVATVATFGVGTGVTILLVGAAYGIADAYIRADLEGKAFTFNSAFEGMINGVTNPFGVTFGVIGGAIAVAHNGPGTNEDLLRAYEYGNRAGTALGTIVGGLAMTGRAAYLRSGNMGYAMKAMAPGAVGAVGGFAYGQMTGQDFATSLEIAAVTSMVMDLGSSLFIKCFVAGTPVWVPVQGDPETWAAASQPGFVAGMDASTAQIAAGVSLAVMTSLSVAALVRPRREEEEIDEETRQRASVDSVFGGSVDSWKELADVLWSDPHEETTPPKWRFG